MALTGAKLTDEIQTLTGRAGSGEPLVDNTRCTRWQNEGQRKIVEKCPELHSMSFKNTTSIDTTQLLSYSIADITVGDSTDRTVCHIFDVYYLDGNESRHLTFIPTDEFDAAYPDPTHSDHSFTKPTHWTRRGNNIEMFPLCATAYCDKDLRFDGDFYARDFTTEDASVGDISGADEGIIKYGVWQAWESIVGGQANALVAKAGFYEWLNGFQEQNDTLHEWEGNLYGGDID